MLVYNALYQLKVVLRYTENKIQIAYLYRAFKQLLTTKLTQTGYFKGYFSKIRQTLVRYLLKIALCTQVFHKASSNSVLVKKNAFILDYI